MLGPPSPTPEAQLIGAGFDTWGGSPFVQQRLALLGKTVFLLAGGFFVVANAVLIAAGGLAVLPALATRANLWHFLAASMMGVLWGLARWRPWSLQVLGLLDAGSLLLAGIGLALMAAGPVAVHLMSGLCALTVTMMARAVLIPSTARRTLVLSGLASAPLLVVALVYHQAPALLPGFSPAFLEALVVVQALLWLIIAVTLSTVTSRTIY